MDISTIYWSDDPCGCGQDVREITLVETIEGEVVRTVLLECSDAGCTTRSWTYAPALAA